MRYNYSIVVRSDIASEAVVKEMVDVCQIACEKHVAAEKSPSERNNMAAANMIKAREGEREREREMTEDGVLPFAERPGQEDEWPLQRDRRRVLHDGHHARAELPALHVLRRLPRDTRLEVRVVCVRRLGLPFRASNAEIVNQTWNHTSRQIPVARHIHIHVPEKISSFRCLSAAAGD